MDAKTTLIMERRKQAAIDSKAEAIRLNLSPEETKWYMFDADSNAIWDAQSNYPYRMHMYKPKDPPPVKPVYSELGFLTAEQRSKLFDAK